MSVLMVTQVSEEDQRRARGMVPRALEPYVVQLAHHGPGSYSMPKVGAAARASLTLSQVTTPRVSRVKEDPELFAGALEQVRTHASTTWTLDLRTT